MRLSNNRPLSALAAALSALVVVSCQVMSGSNSDGTPLNGPGLGGAAGTGGASVPCTTVNNTIAPGAMGLAWNTNTDTMAQAFVVDAKTKLVNLELSFFSMSGANTVTATVYEGGANPTAGVAIATATLTGDFSAYQYYKFVFPANPTLSAGKTYYAVFTSNASTSWTVGMAGAYAGGNYWEQVDLGALFWFDAGSDMLFRINTCS